MDELAFIADIVCVVIFFIYFTSKRFPNNYYDVIKNNSTLCDNIGLSFFCGPDEEDNIRMGLTVTASLVAVDCLSFVPFLSGTVAEKIIRWAVLAFTVLYCILFLLTCHDFEEAEQNLKHLDGAVYDEKVSYEKGYYLYRVCAEYLKIQRRYEICRPIIFVLIVLHGISWNVFRF